MVYNFLIFEVVKNSNQLAMNVAYYSKLHRSNADAIGINDLLIWPIRKIAN
jgi:hypothetical protein